jgi:glycosyltransferase involved in cell wall biosynthesis
MKTTPIKRFRADFPGSVGVVSAMLFHFLAHLGRILRLSKIDHLSTARSDSPRILLVGDNMDGTHGISVSAERLVRQLRGRGHQAWLIGVSHSENPPGYRDQAGWIRMFRASSAQDMFGYEGKELSFPHLPDLLDFLESNPVDLVEIETPGFLGILFVFIARVMGIPIVHNYRTDLLAYFRMLLDNRLLVGVLRRFICAFLRFGNAEVIVPSEAFVEEVHSMGVARSKAHFLRRGVDLSRFTPARGEQTCWESLGAPPGPVVAYLGRVSREKGLEVLAEAFERILRSHPEVVLGVIGDGPWKDEFRRRMAPTGRAIFTGELGGEDLPRALASSAIFAFPSTTDTFGNAVLEALACGVPAVVTDQGGPKEIVEDGRSGLVIPGEDPVALGQALEKLLEDPALRKRLGEGGVARAGLFSPEASCDEHLAFYRRVHGSALARYGKY